MDFFMVGPLKKYQSTYAEQIAKAMVHLAKKPVDHKNIDNQKIKTLSNAYRV